MKIEIREQNNKVEISKRDLREILSVVKWLNKTPNFYYPGRVAWLLLKDAVNYEDRKYTGVKLKGVGIWNPEHLNKHDNVKGERYFELPERPQIFAYNYTKTVPHFGINLDGTFCIKYGEATPFGGLYLDKAYNEYNNALLLLNSHVSCELPLFVCHYSDLTFSERPLGCVVSLLPEKYPCRIDTFLFEEINNNDFEVEYNQRIFASFNSNDYSSDSRFKIFCSILGLYGSELLNFSMAGLFRHSGGVNNLYLNLNEHKVVFTDLDSSCFLNSLPQKIQALEVIRDAASVLFKIIYRLCNPMALNRYSLDTIISNDPFATFLSGYFSKSTPDEIKKVSKILWDYCKPIYLNLYNLWIQKSFKANDWSKYCKIEKDFFFLLSCYLLIPLYKNSDLNHKYPFMISNEDFLHNAKIFLGDRFRRFETILS